MNTRSLILTALFAALTAMGALLRIPLPPSAFTLQLFFALLAGILLGAKYGALSQLVYMALGLLGLPVFTSGGGIGCVLQPTFGFVPGLMAAAWLAGRITRRSASPRRVALAAAAGLAALYAVGLPYMALILNVFMGRGYDLTALLWAGMLPFLPGDCVKVALCCLAAPRLRRRLGNLHQEG